MRIKKIAYALTFFIVAALIFFSCKRKSATKVEPDQYASLSDSVKYIGKEECRTCHSDKFETFIHTGMGMSFDTASQKKSAGRYNSHEVIYDKFRNFYYYPHWEGSELYLTEFRLTGKDTSYLRKEKISYIIGSGQHTNSHMINVNGYVYQAPATFYTQSGKWDLPPGFENGYNNRFSRLIELECMSCHNAYPKLEEGSANKYTSIPNGIDCERCHGPGSFHKEEMLAGRTIDVKNKIDYSIVNPAKLDIDRQMDVCQRCHIQGNAVLKKDKSFFDFKPGMHLSEVMNVFMPVYKGDEDQHIMASHVERMKLSKCFIASMEKVEKYNNVHPTIEPYKNAMTCVTCHNPHISVRSTDKEVFNSACRNCHGGNHTAGTPPISVRGCSADSKSRQLVNDNCVSCHMPKNGTIDIPHVTTTDHWIRKPVSTVNKDQIREFVRLACINNKDVDDVSVGNAYLSYFEKFVSKPMFLDSAKKYLADGTVKQVKENFDALIRWAFLKNDTVKVIDLVSKHGHALDSLYRKSYSNDHAWTAYRIGQAFLNSGNIQNAIPYYSKAVDLAPYYPDFRLKLADLQYQSGDIISSENNYLFIMKENPNFVTAYINYGFLLLSKKSDDRGAEKLYNKALSLDPDNEQALLNKAGVMIYREDLSQAKTILKKVLSINPSNVQAKRLILLL